MYAIRSYYGGAGRRRSRRAGQRGRGGRRARGATRGAPVPGTLESVISTRLPSTTAPP